MRSPYAVLQPAYPGALVCSTHRSPKAALKAANDLRALFDLTLTVRRLNVAVRAGDYVTRYDHLPVVSE